mmetsp:Transcript_1847/g.6567  ORF Transcript_1847/g.6567 Transcript_1847/m.6567 type:complete len:82 (-) Transcript_1847:1533-1778(-)
MVNCDGWVWLKAKSECPLIFFFHKNQSVHRRIALYIIFIFSKARRRQRGMTNHSLFGKAIFVFFNNSTVCSIRRRDLKIPL